MGADEEQFETEVYKHISTQMGLTDQPHSIIQVLKTINDGQYITECQQIQVRRRRRIRRTTCRQHQLIASDTTRDEFQCQGLDGIVDQMFHGNVHDAVINMVNAFRTYTV